MLLENYTWFRRHWMISSLYDSAFAVSLHRTVTWVRVFKFGTYMHFDQWYMHLWPFVTTFVLICFYGFRLISMHLSWLYSDYAWNVIKEYAVDVMDLYKDEVGGTQVSSPMEKTPPSPTGRRPSKEITELYKDLGKRRYTLANQTSIINDITGRTSVDLYDDETLAPRSRAGSRFPVNCFVDDFAQATRSRSGSLLPGSFPLRNVAENESHNDSD